MSKMYSKSLEAQISELISHQDSDDLPQQELEALSHVVLASYLMETQNKVISPIMVQYEKRCDRIRELLFILTEDRHRNRSNDQIYMATTVPVTKCGRIENGNTKNSKPCSKNMNEVMCEARRLLRVKGHPSIDIPICKSSIGSGVSDESYLSLFQVPGATASVPAAISSDIGDRNSRNQFRSSFREISHVVHSGCIQSLEGAIYYAVHVLLGLGALKGSNNTADRIKDKENNTRETEEEYSSYSSFSLLSVIYSGSQDKSVLVEEGDLSVSQRMGVAIILTEVGAWLSDILDAHREMTTLYSELNVAVSGENCRNTRHGYIEREPYSDGEHEAEMLLHSELIPLGIPEHCAKIGVMKITTSVAKLLGNTYYGASPAECYMCIISLLRGLSSGEDGNVPGTANVKGGQSWLYNKSRILLSEAWGRLADFIKSNEAVLQRYPQPSAALGMLCISPMWIQDTAMSQELHLPNWIEITSEEEAYKVLKVQFNTSKVRGERSLYTIIDCRVEAVKAHPMSPLTWNNLGVCLAIVTEDVIVKRRDIFEKRPTGVCINLHTTKDKSITVTRQQCFIRAISLDPNCSIAWLNLADTLVKLTEELTVDIKIDKIDRSEIESKKSPTTVTKKDCLCRCLCSVEVAKEKYNENNKELGVMEEQFLLNETSHISKAWCSMGCLLVEEELIKRDQQLEKLISKNNEENLPSMSNTNISKSKSQLSKLGVVESHIDDEGGIEDISSVYDSLSYEDMCLIQDSAAYVIINKIPYNKLRCFIRAVEEDKKNVEAWNNLGTALDDSASVRSKKTTTTSLKCDATNKHIFGNHKLVHDSIIKSNGACAVYIHGVLYDKESCFATAESLGSAVAAANYNSLQEATEKERVLYEEHVNSEEVNCGVVDEYGHVGLRKNKWESKMSEKTTCVVA